jgi:hypothetical protein
VPQLQWKTWVRLAFVEAGSDWRSLNKLAIDDGMLRDYLLVPEMHNGGYGVRAWDESAGVVASESRPSNGAFSVADPRVEQSEQWNQGQHYGVHAWEESTGTIGAQQWPNQGRFSVADPRCGATKHNNCFRVVRFDQAAGTVTGGGHPSAGGQAVADPRPHDGPLFSKYPVSMWDEPSRTVIGGDDTGAYAVADPRPGWDRHGSNMRVMDWQQPSGTVIAGGKGVQGGWMSVADPRTGMDGERDAYLTGGHYGVLRMSDTAGAVSAAACHDNGRWSVADHRMPAATDKLVARIRSLDGTWHRPFTTLELAALQSLFDPEDPADCAAFSMACVDVSKSDGTHREWIGNAVPPEGIETTAVEMLRTLMLADAGETFQLNAAPIWVRPVIAGLSLAQGATS